MSRTAERLVRHKRTRNQFDFALEAKAVLPPCDASLLAASHGGLHVLANSPGVLARRIAQARTAYGDALNVEAPREHQGRSIETRIGLQIRHVAAVRYALEQRGINPSEEYTGVHYCVLRFQAPFACLLGIPGHLAALTRDTATHVFLLGKETRCRR
jgi:hypothetical protein